MDRPNAAVIMAWVILRDGSRRRELGGERGIRNNVIEDNVAGNTMGTGNCCDLGKVAQN